MPRNLVMDGETVAAGFQRASLARPQSGEKNLRVPSLISTIGELGISFFWSRSV